ncbi:hypothetical protein Dda_5542 [Drechslerella dactyloides]|uniref:Protein BIG1 n=1 Tax=Drechslerella dactyloides TaxID=74499 RepID=A0AAD6NKB8_DREDA|nr:hypothetical protein Dda_5542 [Drechslerella dactyloides]
MGRSRKGPNAPAFRVPLEVGVWAGAFKGARLAVCGPCLRRTWLAASTSSPKQTLPNLQPFRPRRPRTYLQYLQQGRRERHTIGYGTRETKSPIYPGREHEDGSSLVRGTGTAGFRLCRYVTTLPVLHRETFGTAEQFLDAVKSTVSQCTSDAYILILQPGAHETDFKDPRSAPQIRKFAETDRFRSVMDAVGYVDLNVVEDFVKAKCQAHTVTVDASSMEPSGRNSGVRFEENSTAQVIKLDFPVLPIHSEARKKGHTQNDHFLSALISMMPTAKYTVIYVSTPVGDPGLLVPEKQPEPQKHESFVTHQSILARDVQDVQPEDDDDNVGGVLSRYQFVTPSL